MSKHLLFHLILCIFILPQAFGNWDSLTERVKMSKRPSEDRFGMMFSEKQSLVIKRFFEQAKNSGVEKQVDGVPHIGGDNILCNVKGDHRGADGQYKISVHRHENENDRCFFSFDEKKQRCPT